MDGWFQVTFDRENPQHWCYARRVDKELEFVEP